VRERVHRTSLLYHCGFIHSHATCLEVSHHGNQTLRSLLKACYLQKLCIFDLAISIMLARSAGVRHKGSIHRCEFLP